MENEKYTYGMIEELLTEDISRIFAELNSSEAETNLTFNRVKIYNNPEKDGKIDLLLEYNSSNPQNKWTEDALFNAIAGEKLTFNGIPVDINPITPEKSGTINEYLERLRKLEKSKNVYEQLDLGQNMNKNDVIVKYAFQEYISEKELNERGIKGVSKILTYEEPRWTLKDTAAALKIIKEADSALYETIQSYIKEQHLPSENTLYLDFGKSLRYDDEYMGDFSKETLSDKLDNRFIVRYSHDNDDGNLIDGGDEIIINDKELVSLFNGMIEGHVKENIQKYDEYKIKREEIKHEHIKARAMSNSEKIAESIINPKLNPTEYVLNKLKEKGIEVVTDKEEFDRILESQAILQKMTDNLSKLKKLTGQLNEERLKSQILEKTKEKQEKSIRWNNYKDFVNFIEEAKEYIPVEKDFDTNRNYSSEYYKIKNRIPIEFSSKEATVWVVNAEISKNVVTPVIIERSYTGVRFLSDFESVKQYFDDSHVFQNFQTNIKSILQKNISLEQEKQTRFIDELEKQTNEIKKIEKREAYQTVSNWIYEAEEKAEYLWNKEKEDVKEFFKDNDERKFIGIIPSECMQLFEGIEDYHLYADKSYLIHHYINRHPDVRLYDNIQNVLDNYTNIYYDNEQNSIGFVKVYGNLADCLFVKNDNGKIVLFGSTYNQPEFRLHSSRYKKITPAKEQEQNMSLEGSTPLSQNPVGNTAAAISDVNDKSNISQSSKKSTVLDDGSMFVTQMKTEEVKANIYVTSPSDIVPYLNDFAKSEVENFGIVMLDGSNKVKEIRSVSVGTVNRSLVHSREVFREAIRKNAATVLVFHNHPSGNTEPSIEDIQTTKRLMEASNIIGIQVLDHIIVSPDNYFSFVEHDLLVDKTQKMILPDGITYGFTHNDKIYLNPNVMNSEAAVHEYTHLWDNLTRKENPELWNKGLQIFKGTSIWNEVVNDENYADIKNDENLVLSECHARITGKVAEIVLRKIAELDGTEKQADMIDWDRKTIDFIYANYRDVFAKNGFKTVAEFAAASMKELFNPNREINSYKESINYIKEQLEKESGIKVNERLVDEIYSRYEERDLQLEPFDNGLFRITDTIDGKYTNLINIQDVVKQVIAWDDKELSELHDGTADDEEIKRIKDYIEDLEHVNDQIVYSHALTNLDFNNKEHVQKVKDMLGHDFKLTDEEAKVLLTYATHFDDGTHEYGLSKDGHLHFRTNQDNEGWSFLTEESMQMDFLTSAFDGAAILLDSDRTNDIDLLNSFLQKNESLLNELDNNRFYTLSLKDVKEKIKEIDMATKELTVTHSVTFPCGFIYPDSVGKTEREMNNYRKKVYKKLQEKYGFTDNYAETSHWTMKNPKDSSFNINFTVSVPEDIKTDENKVNAWIDEVEKFSKEECGCTFINWQGGERFEQTYINEKQYRMQLERNKDFANPDAENLEPASIQDIKDYCKLNSEIELSDKQLEEIHNFYDNNDQFALYVSPAGNLYVRDEYDGNLISADSELLKAGNYLRTLEGKERLEYLLKNISIDEPEWSKGLLNQTSNDSDERLRIVSDVLSDSFATLDRHDGFWQLLLEYGADPTRAIRIAAEDANLGDNLNWLLSNVPESHLNQIFSDNGYADAVFDIAKKSVEHDMDSWHGGADIGFEGFKRIARLCEREADADRYYGELLEKAFEEETVKNSSPKERYMLLSRMQSDCEYYLGNGNRNAKHLWAGEERQHIKNMVSLYNSFSFEDKPEWLTLEQLDNYSKELTGKSLAEHGWMKSIEENNVFQEVQTGENQKQKFILDKLAAAGIEVVQDKAEFDRILESEKVLQKMTEDFSEFEKLSEELNTQKSKSLELEDKKKSLEERKIEAEKQHLEDLASFAEKISKYLPVEENPYNKRTYYRGTDKIKNKILVIDNEDDRNYSWYLANIEGHMVFVHNDNAREARITEIRDYDKIKGYIGTDAIFSESIIEELQNNLKTFLEQNITLEKQKQNRLLNDVGKIKTDLLKASIENKTLESDFARLDNSLRFNANFEIESAKLGEPVSVFPGSTGKSGLGIRHIIEERFKNDNLSLEEITALTVLVLDSVRNGNITRENDYQAEFTKNGIVAIVRKEFFGNQQNWILTGFAYDKSNLEENREATEAIKTVIANYSNSDGYSYFRSQVGAVIASLNPSITQTIQKSSIQNFVQSAYCSM